MGEVIDFKSKQVIEKGLIPFQHFFIQALIDWLTANDKIPYAHILEDYEGVNVPKGYSSEGLIALNLSAEAVVDFQINNESISFKATFGGKDFYVSFPPSAVVAISDGKNAVIPILKS